MSQGNRLKACHTVDMAGRCAAVAARSLTKRKSSARRLEKSARDLQQRALAAAARSDDGRHLAGQEPAAHAGQRDYGLAGLRGKGESDIP